MKTIHALFLAATSFFVPLAFAKGGDSSGGGNIAKLRKETLRLNEAASQKTILTVEKFLLEGDLKKELKNWVQKLKGPDIVVASEALDLDPFDAKRLVVSNQDKLLQDIVQSSYIVSRLPLFVEDDAEEKDAITFHHHAAQVSFNIMQIARYDLSWKILKQRLVQLAFHEHIRHFKVNDESHAYGRLASIVIEGESFFYDRGRLLYEDEIEHLVIEACAMAPGTGCSLDLPVNQMRSKTLGQLDLADDSGAEGFQHRHRTKFQFTVLLLLKKMNIIFSRDFLASLKRETTVAQIVEMILRLQNYSVDGFEKRVGNSGIVNPFLKSTAVLMMNGFFYDRQRTLDPNEMRTVLLKTCEIVGIRPESPAEVEKFFEGTLEGFGILNSSSSVEMISKSREAFVDVLLAILAKDNIEMSPMDLVQALVEKNSLQKVLEILVKSQQHPLEISAH